MSLAGRYLGLVKFEHTIFAMPFALMSLLVAADGRPEPATLLWVIVAMIGARSAAMAFNRLADRHYDAQNPRTIDRHIPAGEVSVAGAAVFIVISSVLLVFAARNLNPLCFALSPVALAVVFFYSLTKRFSAWSHVFLGAALAVAPVGAWLAVTGRFDGFPLFVALGVTLWVAGFDAIYGCQDADFDRRVGLHSLAVRYGRTGALTIAKVMHVLAVIALWSAFRLEPALGVVARLGLVVMAVLLVWEHRIVRGGDLSRIDVAFFTVNSWIGMVLFGFVVLDLYLP